MPGKRKRSHPLLKAKNDAWMALRAFEHGGGETGSDEHRRLTAALDEARVAYEAAGEPRFEEAKR